MKISSILVALVAALMATNVMGQQETANGRIRWYTTDETRDSPYELRKTISMASFLQKDGVSYDVVLTGDSSHILRLNTSDGSYFEMKGVSKRRQQPLFQPIEITDKFRGKILYPNGLDRREFAGQSWGKQPVDFDNLQLIPIAGGFRAVVLDDESMGDGLVLTTDIDLQPTDIFSKQLQRQIGYEGVCASADTAALICGMNSRSVFILGVKSGKVGGWSVNDQRDLGLSIGNKNAVLPVSSDAGQFVAFVKKDTIGRFDGTTKVAPLPAGSVHNDRDPCCLMNDGRRIVVRLAMNKQSEIHLFDTATLKSIASIPISLYSGSDIRLQSHGNHLLVHLDDGPFLVFDCSGDQFKLVGRSSSLLGSLESCETWTVSDDGKCIFFVGSPIEKPSALMIGAIEVQELKLQGRKEVDTTSTPAGLAKLQQDEIGFDDLPANAPPQLVGVLPDDVEWKEFSPDDRWLLGEKSGVILYHTGTREIFRTAMYFHRAFFSKDSSRLFLQGNDGWEIWNMSGDEPSLIVKTSRYDKTLDPYSQLFDHSLRLQIDQDRILAMSEQGGALFKYDASAVRPVFDFKIDTTPAAASADWSRMIVSKEDGSVWYYAIEEAGVKGLSKVVLSGYPESGAHRLLGTNGDRLIVQSRRQIQTWVDSGKGFGDANVLETDSHRVFGISQKGDWIALKHERDDKLNLLLFDDRLKQVATMELPYSLHRYANEAIVANDGRHVVVSASGGKNVSLLYRLR